MGRRRNADPFAALRPKGEGRFRVWVGRGGEWTTERRVHTGTNSHGKFEWVTKKAEYLPVKPLRFVGRVDERSQATRFIKGRTGGRVPTTNGWKLNRLMRDKITDQWFMVTDH